MPGKAIFLDRDGVLNHAIIKNGKPYPPSCMQELTLAADAATSLLSLKAAGFLLIVVTNQPDVTRGSTPVSLVEQINQHLMQKLPLDEICVCYHDDAQECLCRKPKPGLLIDAAQRYHLDLTQSVMIGDRWRDIDAGHAAGCKTIWLKQDYDEKSPSQPADFIASCLAEATLWVKAHL
jgi:D-glycero-D-manno-heptose 1,7-bisphosphate phosphatase